MNNKDFKKLLNKLKKSYFLTIQDLNKLNPKQKNYILKNFNFIIIN